MKGPCPSCGAVISIPKEAVKMYDDDEVASKKGNGQNSRPRPISRLDIDLDPRLVGRYAAVVLGVLLLAFMLGCIPMYTTFRTFIGVVGLCLVAFPLTLFGYQVMRDREVMFAFTGNELYRRSGIVAAGYVFLWFGFEYFLAIMQADVFAGWLYFVAFAGLATLLVHPLLNLKTRDAFLHYCMFGFSAILLRFLIGFGWFWESSGLIRYSSAPPPPLLPGM